MKPRHKKLILSAALATSCSAWAAPLQLGVAYGSDTQLNEAVRAGVKEAIHELHGKVKSEKTNSLQALQSLSKTQQVIISTGNPNAVIQAARSAPKVRFISLESPAKPPQIPNINWLSFKDDESALSAGFVSGHKTNSGKVAVLISAGEISAEKMQASAKAFERGLKMSCPTCKSQTKTVTKAQAQAETKKLISAGTDVIFVMGQAAPGVEAQIKKTPCIKMSSLPKGSTWRHQEWLTMPKSTDYRKKCGGNTQPAFFIPALQTNLRGDFDKNPATLNHALTITLRHMQNAVKQSLLQASGLYTWKSGVQSYGLEHKSVGVLIDHYNRASLGDELIKKLGSLEKVISENRLNN